MKGQRHRRHDRPEHGPRWRRRAEARPDDILDAARECFLEEGYSGATVERIARGAGLSKGAVYLYFESKEAMLVALIRRSVRMVAEAAAARLDAQGEAGEGAGGDPVAALREAAGQFGALLADPKMFAAPRIVLAEAGRFPQIAELYRREVLDIAMPAIARLVERAKATGAFRDVDARVAVRSLVGGMFVEALWRSYFAQAGEPAPAPQDFIAAHLDIVLNGLCARPETPGGDA
jgi:AcrR family transcriptional regulator